MKELIDAMFEHIDKARSSKGIELIGIVNTSKVETLEDLAVYARQNEAGATFGQYIQFITCVQVLKCSPPKNNWTQALEVMIHFHKSNKNTTFKRFRKLAFKRHFRHSMTDDQKRHLVGLKKEFKFEFETVTT